MDYRTVHSSRGYINERDGATTNCFCWRNNLRCTVLESSTSGDGLVYVNEKKERMIMIRFKQVLVTGVTMMEISERNMLPKTCNRKEATNQEAMKIDDEDIKEII